MATPGRRWSPGALSALAGALLASPGPAAAQSTERVTIDLTPTWEEVNGNSNGVLEPGESARIRVSLAMSPPIGTVIEILGPVHNFIGTIRGISGAVFDLRFQDAGGGTYLTTGATGGIPNGRPPGWDVVPGGNGQVHAGEDAIVNIQPAQFPFNSLDYDPVTNPNGVRQDNPLVAAYTAVWTPASYTPRTVTVGFAFGVNGRAALFFRISEDPTLPPTATSCLATLGSVSIPVVPAPAGAAALIAASVLAARRRRQKGPS